MASLEEARRAWRAFKSQYQEVLPYRTAVMGDGRGTASSNVNVPGRTSYVYARDNYEDNRFYQILNRSNVQPAANLPIIIGYDLYSGIEEEQVIGVNYSGFGDNDPLQNPTIGPHHWQHEFQGGDQVTIDSRQFFPGLIHPTNPPTMAVKVGTFVYFYRTWERWDTDTTKLFTEYRPGSGYIRTILIALDPEARELHYHIGPPFSTGSLDVTLGRFTIVPAPPATEIPLGYVRLENGMTSIDWSMVNNNIGDARLFLNVPTLYLLDRIRQLEGYVGNDSSLPATGAAQDILGDSNGLVRIADSPTWSGNHVFLNNVGFAGAVNPTQAITIDGETARQIIVARRTANNVAGNSLTFQSGGATLGATNRVGGNLLFQTGVGTGNAIPAQIRFAAPALGSASGTTDQTNVNRLIVNGTDTLTSGAARTLLQITLASGEMASGQLFYSIEATDGTDMISAFGSVYFAAVNKAAAYTTNSSIIGTEAQALSDGTDTISNTFGFATGINLVNFQITSTVTGMTPTTFRITYSTISGSQQAIVVA